MTKIEKEALEMGIFFTEDNGHSLEETALRFNVCKQTAKRRLDLLETLCPSLFYDVIEQRAKNRKKWRSF